VALPSRFPSFAKPAAVAFTIALSGCAAPQYDSQTDKLITTLQTDTDTLLVHLIAENQQIAALSGRTDKTSLAALDKAKTAAGYLSNIPAYEQIDVDLLSLKTRIDAEPNASTSHLDASLKDLNDNLFGTGSLEAQHAADSILPNAYLTTEQIILDTQLTALLKYELVLKSGAPSTNAS
jgi:hypothetical protein